MNRASVLLLCLGAAVLLSAAPVHSGGGPADLRSLDVYPTQEIPLRFFHARHLETGLVCEVCHSSALMSEQSSDRNLPGHELCAACHRSEQPDAHEAFPKAGCADCHEGWTEGLPSHIGPDLRPLPDAPKPPPVVMPPARITFSHKLHLGTGAVCLDCHKGIPEAERGTRQHLPTMYTCLSCHDGRKAPDECTTCHLQDPGDGRVAVALAQGDPLAPIGRFRPDDHSDPEWLHRHEFAARADQDQCAACHEQAQCLQCHDGVQKLQRIHPGDWQMTHGLQAQRRDLECAACHDKQDFCASCHTRVGVTPGSFPGLQADPVGAARFHPEGWGGELGAIPGPEHHSHTARRSLETCSSCHAPEQCVECHSFVNPHPDRYADPKSWGFGQGDGAVCSTCHRANDPLLDGVR